MIPKVKRVNSPAHEARVRALPCCVLGCHGKPVETHHERRGTGGGTGLKPDSRWVVSLCLRHHREGHTIGWNTFEKRYSLDLRAIAADNAMMSRGLGLLSEEAAE